MMKNEKPIELLRKTMEKEAFAKMLILMKRNNIEKYTLPNLNQHLGMTIERYYSFNDKGQVLRLERDGRVMNWNDAIRNESVISVPEYLSSIDQLSCLLQVSENITQFCKEIVRMEKEVIYHVQQIKGIDLEHRGNRKVLIEKSYF
jgi:hypothetical protein